MNIMTTQELVEDPILNGQKWTNIVFLSQEDPFEKKVLYIVKDYLKNVVNDKLTSIKQHLASNVNNLINNQFDDNFAKLNKSINTRDKVVLAMLKHIRSSINIDENIISSEALMQFGDKELKNIRSDLKIFHAQNYEEFENDFNDIKDGQLTIRGFKSRGFFPTIKRVKMQADMLTTKVEKGIHCMLVRNGFWTAWMPYRDPKQPLSEEDNKYVNDWMNETMRRYIARDDEKKRFYTDRLEQAKDKQRSRRQRRIRGKFIEKVSKDDNENYESDSDEEPHTLDNFPVNDDYLVEDDSIYGQTYGCISFVTPSKKIINERFNFIVMKFLHYQVNQTIRAMFTHMSKNINQQVRKAFNSDIESLGRTKNEEDKIIADLLEEIMKKIQLEEEECDINKCVSEYLISNDQISGSFRSFYNNKIKLIENDSRFLDLEHSNPRLHKISGGEIHMFKLRGGFEDFNDAKKWAQEQRDTKESHIDGTTVMIGGWGPFNPNTDTIQSDHANKELANIMQKYNDNIHMRNQFQRKKIEQDRMRSHDKSSSCIRDKLRRKLGLRRKLKTQKELKEFLSENGFESNSTLENKPKISKKKHK